MNNRHTPAETLLDVSSAERVCFLTDTSLATPLGAPIRVSYAPKRVAMRFRGYLLETFVHVLELLMVTTCKLI